ncbi:hypothetical protein CEUSTIGMA_g12429.t1 [Chlamydomonas eustigma]|uniref:Major facilitator superfamily (MFS) profile domain-containing protein n=1 Tax=Chlamydomonas eustigma TaxID=1157962 RepID=A0A250XPM1_9CHLO|nr:hypothetical protein CEUSTIGMA_g12429.t1 [Chlamydomonas eustigma]|eukprot:GAX85008.1 hypothetical protein CEUSTIGMA_g12429.t1 [Chlamydomonas eustigma]
MLMAHAFSRCSNFKRILKSVHACRQRSNLIRVRNANQLLELPNKSNHASLFPGNTLNAEDLSLESAQNDSNYGRDADTFSESKKTATVHVRDSVPENVSTAPAAANVTFAPWKIISFTVAISMLFINAHRSVFTMSLPVIASDMVMDPKQLGLLQSAMLSGYLLGQLPSGSFADSFGGDRVLMIGLFLSSAALAAAASAPGLIAVTPLIALAATRVAFGLFSAAAMPSVSAMVATWVPHASRSTVTALIYAAFNMGGVLGLALTPAANYALGWEGTLVGTGAVGAVWAFLGWACLQYARGLDNRSQQPAAVAEMVSRPVSVIVGHHIHDDAKKRVNERQTRQPAAAAAAADGGVNNERQTRQPAAAATAAAGDDGGVNERQTRQPSAAADGGLEMSTTGSGLGTWHDKSSTLIAGSSSLLPATAYQETSSAPSFTSLQPAATSSNIIEPWRNSLKVGVLCWCHGVIGWGFFVMSSWLPMYLTSLGHDKSLLNVGVMSSLPYLATAVVMTFAGTIADKLINMGIVTLKVRKIMHGLSAVGCAATILPLALSSSCSPEVATLWLIAFQCCYAVSFGGFHPHVQEVAGRDAGLMLGITNSCSIAMGILGNLITGMLVSNTGCFSTVFALTSLLYISSAIAFLTFMDGRPVRLSSANHQARKALP